jgi:hypothetical protein
MTEGLRIGWNHFSYKSALRSNLPNENRSYGKNWKSEDLLQDLTNYNIKIYVQTDLLFNAASI